MAETLDAYKMIEYEFLEQPMLVLLPSTMQAKYCG